MKIVSAVLPVSRFCTGEFAENPEDVAAGPERPVRERLRRHLAEPVVEHTEPAGQVAGHRTWFGVNPVITCEYSS
ncbi:MAG TPA: hypothetical protein VFC16_04295 [Nakamurella sp.]|nr:hypothetical protein [Nakamurella sp.]